MPLLTPTMLIDQEENYHTDEAEGEGKRDNLVKSSWRDD